MEKKVFLELTKEETLRKINIDPRLVDSFKRVMVKIQEYFDNHGYSEMVDYETIIKDYVLPRESVDREAIRHSTEFMNALHETRENQKKLESILTITLEPIEEESFLNEYIKRNYNVGLSFEVENKEKKLMHSGIYKDYVKTIGINEVALDSIILDRIICHEFIHFLTMCGKDNLNSVDQAMTPSTYESLTEMLTSEVLDVEPASYKSYCELMQYLNLLVGVEGYKFFLQRQLDPKYEKIGFVLEIAQNIFDRHRFSQTFGNMEESELNDLVFTSTTHLLFRDYKSIDELIDNMVKIYSAPQFYSNLEGFETLQDGIVDLYLSENKITNPEIKTKIMQLIKLKNERRIMGNMNCISLNINNESYLLDENGSLYLKRLNAIYKLDQQGMLMSYKITDGILRVFTETGVYSCDLNSIDFKATRLNLAKQQQMLESKIDMLVKGINMNRPYINSDTVSTVIARDTCAKAEVLEPIQSKLKLRRPHIKKETMSMLQGKIEKYKLDIKMKQLLTQKEIVQKMMTNQQAITNAVVEEEEEQDMGMSL